MTPAERTRAALELLGRPVPPSLGARAAVLARAAMLALDASGSPEARALVTAIDTVPQLIGPGGMAALARGDLGGVVDAVASQWAAKAESWATKKRG